jgi:hypothetical protein
LQPTHATTIRIHSFVAALIANVSGPNAVGSPTSTATVAHHRNLHADHSRERLEVAPADATNSYDSDADRHLINRFLLLFWAKCKLASSPTFRWRTA